MLSGAESRADVPCCMEQGRAGFYHDVWRIAEQGCTMLSGAEQSRAGSTILSGEEQSRCTTLSGAKSRADVPCCLEKSRADIRYCQEHCRAEQGCSILSGREQSRAEQGDAVLSGRQQITAEVYQLFL